MHAILLSDIEEVSRIRFRPFPHKPTQLRKVVKVGDLIVGVGMRSHPSVVMVSDRRLLKPTSIRTGSYSNDSELMAALHAVGAVSDKARQIYLDACKKQRKDDRMRYARDALVESADTLGVTLTKNQLKRAGVARAR